MLTSRCRRSAPWNRPHAHPWPTLGLTEGGAMLTTLCTALNMLADDQRHGTLLIHTLDLLYREAVEECRQLGTGIGSLSLDPSSTY